MLRGIVNAKNNRDLRIKAIDFEAGKIRFGIENQSVSAALDRLTDQEKRLYAAIRIRRGMTKLSPTFVSVLYCQGNRNTTGWRATRDVENVRRDGAH
jgi:hypothetical protein